MLVRQTPAQLNPLQTAAAPTDFRSSLSESKRRPPEGDEAGPKNKASQGVSFTEDSKVELPMGGMTGTDDEATGVDVRLPSSL